MATKKSVLLEQLAMARRKKAEKARQKPSEAPEKPSAPPPEPEATPERDVPADTQRELADACAKDAMIMGWARSIQKHAYENRISEDEMKRVLDAALEYNDKADPSGRIDELEDWEREKRGRSELAVRATRP